MPGVSGMGLGGLGFQWGAIAMYHGLISSNDSSGYRWNVNTEIECDDNPDTNTSDALFQIFVR